MIDVIDAPMPFLIGVEYDILVDFISDTTFEEITLVNLDTN